MKYITLAFLSLSVFFTCPKSTYAEDSIPPIDSADKAYAFALVLYKERDYFRAVTEFKRYGFEKGTPEALRKACYASAVCYQVTREWQRALAGWRELVVMDPLDPNIPEYAYRIAECLMASGSYTELNNMLLQFLPQCPKDSDYLDDAHFLRGSCLLAMRNWKDAETQFLEYQSLFPSGALLNEAKSMEEGARAINKMRRRDPKKAVVLSAIVPGLGQFYAGRSGDGWTALLVNAFFGWSTYNRFHNKDYHSAVPLLFVESSFYTGNVYGAGGAVTSRNRQKEDELLAKTVAKVEDGVRSRLGHPERLQPKP